MPNPFDELQTQITEVKNETSTLSSNMTTVATQMSTLASDMSILSSNMSTAATQISTISSDIELVASKVESVSKRMSIVPVRQTVLSGQVDSNGYANFLEAGTGLAVNLKATATPVRIAFADGFDENGATDYIGSFTVDETSAFSSLSASNTSFLYAERNSSTGELTYGSSLLQPVYGYITPSSPSNDQHFFSIPEMKMKVYNSGTSNWDEEQRVFLGEVLTGNNTASSVTSITSSGTTATVTTPSAHGLQVGSTVEIAGADQAEYNGQYTIVIVPTSTTFTYTFAGSTTTPATGTITYKPLIIDVITYALQGNYNSGIFTINTSSAANKNHNIGTDLIIPTLFARESVSYKWRLMTRSYTQTSVADAGLVTSHNRNISIVTYINATVAGANWVSDAANLDGSGSNSLTSAEAMLIIKRAF